MSENAIDGLGRARKDSQDGTHWEFLALGLAPLPALRMRSASPDWHAKMMWSDVSRSLWPSPESPSLRLTRLYAQVLIGAAVRRVTESASIQRTSYFRKVQHEEVVPEHSVQHPPSWIVSHEGFPVACNR